MNDEKESEYYTIIELLQEMPTKKLLLFMFGFYVLIFTMTMSFMYWYLKR